MKVTWMLPEILKKNDISAWKLGQTAPRESERVVYNFARQEAPKQIHISTLELVISTLKKMGVEVTPDDLFKIDWVSESSSK